MTVLKPLAILAVVAFCLSPLASRADEPRGPSPDLSPRDVVAIQLNALRNNDDPSPDAGIAQTWALAHPNNRRFTGPLERFARMIRSPLYRDLIGHTAHEIEEVSATDQEVTFKVVVEAASGNAIEYVWSVGRAEIAGGEKVWMTVRVSRPQPAGQAT